MTGVEDYKGTSGRIGATDFHLVIMTFLLTFHLIKYRRGGRLADRNSDDKHKEGKILTLFRNATVSRH
jgi:hypothetical protein